MSRLKGKTTIVTGGGQGIGAAIALRFATEGARVVIAELNQETGDATARDIAAQTGADVICIQTDVSEPDSIKNMHDKAVAAFGVVDVLVNNAGIAVFHEPLESTMEDWRKCMSVDLEGVWHCCRQVLPDMLKKGEGAIINIVSNHAFTVMKSTFPYPVAKHGLLGLTRSLALEYANRGVAVNAISPGYVETPVADWYFNQQDDPVAARAETEAKQPVGRLCRPSEVAAIATMLASDEARFMIGENIVIDGGVTIRMYE
ncbi:MAG: SDR family oxidoreductase [Paracoccaceae bacterium]|nr:SDR family oxidoreductase [Paracoccaceae bacterium]MDG2260000.1 SDR family oxidoreductase [Paracoccaceae bacterium]